jgi:hypothetical protein
MKKIHYYLAMAFMTAIAMPMSAQVSSDNEDGVYKVQRPQAKDYVQGEVLFKLKDGKEAKVRRVAGRVQSAGISSLDAVLTEFDVEDVITTSGVNLDPTESVSSERENAYGSYNSFNIPGSWF